MLPYDNYGRTVTLTTTNNIDSYAVSDGATTIYFTLSFPTGTDIVIVYNTINALVTGE